MFGAGQILEKFARAFDRFGFFWVGLIFLVLIGNAAYLVKILILTWAFSYPVIVTTEGDIGGSDFIALWPALGLALGGEAELAYDRLAIKTVLQQLTGIETWADKRFLHPPTYLLVMLPLGLLPYFSALALWQILPFVGFLFVMAHMGLPRVLFWLLPLSGAVVTNIASGQNGLLLGLFLAGGLLSLERHPRLAGVLFALVTVKPQIALLIAPALLVGRHWSALGVMAATVAVMIIGSFAAFGPEPWFAFFQNLPFALDQLTLGNLPWRRIPPPEPGGLGRNGNPLAAA